jgi:hypothetical protein
VSASSAAAAPILTVQPSASTVTVGDVFSVNIGIEDVTDLLFYQFGITFDPTVLQAVVVDDVNPDTGIPFKHAAVASGGFLSGGGVNPTNLASGEPDNVGGSVGFIQETLTSATDGTTGAGSLVTLQFVALHAGMSALGLTFDFANNGDALYDSFFTPIDGVTSVDGSVNVVASTTPAPEPTSIVLLGSGLAGAWYRRRRRHAA